MIIIKFRSGAEKEDQMTKEEQSTMWLMEKRISITSSCQWILPSVSVCPPEKQILNKSEGTTDFPILCQVSQEESNDVKQDVSSIFLYLL